MKISVLGQPHFSYVDNDEGSEDFYLRLRELRCQRPAVAGAAPLPVAEDGQVPVSLPAGPEDPRDALELGLALVSETPDQSIQLALQDRHDTERKERKFGLGCLQEWRRQKNEIKKTLIELLKPFEQMLKGRPYLLDERPCFVDFDLWGMIANYQYSGNHRLPAVNNRLRQWYRRLGQLSLGPTP